MPDDKAETSDRQLSPVDAAAVDALPAGHALLVVQRGPERRQPVPARHRRRQRRPPPRQRDLPRRRHRLAPARGVPPRRATSFTVSDVGSLNGTYVNRDRIDSVELNDGDEVQIGKYRLVFFSGHPAS